MVFPGQPKTGLLFPFALLPVRAEMLAVVAGAGGNNSLYCYKCRWEEVNLHTPASFSCPKQGHAVSHSFHLPTTQRASPVPHPSLLRWAEPLGSGPCPHTTALHCKPLAVPLVGCTALSGNTRPVMYYTERLQKS